MSWFGILPYTVTAGDVGVVLRFGKLVATRLPGLHFRLPFIDKVYRVSTRLQETNTEIRAKTSDNVFTNVGIMTQYQIKPENAFTAMTSLTDRELQMHSFINNSVRATIPKFGLVGLFDQRDIISGVVGNELKTRMEEYGITVTDTQIVNIVPPEETINAMNAVQQSLNKKLAAEYESQAEYIKSVKSAEADAEKKRLQGIGTANQRDAILEGFNTSIEKMSKNLKISPALVLSFVENVQRVDAMIEIARNSATRTLFMPYEGKRSLVDDVMRSNEAVDRSDQPDRS